MAPWPSTFFFSSIQQFSNKKFNVLRQKLQSKAQFLIWFCVTHSCSFGERNLNNIFLATKFVFIQSLWTTLVIFVWQKHMHNELVVFPFKKRCCSGLSLIFKPCDYGNQFYLEKKKRIVQSSPTWLYLAPSWQQIDCQFFNYIIPG